MVSDLHLPQGNGLTQDLARDLDDYAGNVTNGNWWGAIKSLFKMNGNVWKNSYSTKEGAVLTTMSMILPIRGASPLTIGAKVEAQMVPRGWTAAAIVEARTSGQQVQAVNMANGNAATRYVHPQTGQSMVVDKVTGEVIHVGGPGFKYGPNSGDLPWVQ